MRDAYNQFLSFLSPIYIYLVSLVIHQSNYDLEVDPGQVFGSIMTYPRGAQRTFLGFELMQKQFFVQSFCAIQYIPILIKSFWRRLLSVLFMFYFTQNILLLLYSKSGERLLLRDIPRSILFLGIPRYLLFVLILITEKKKIYILYCLYLYIVYSYEIPDKRGTILEGRGIMKFMKFFDWFFPEKRSVLFD